MTTQGEIRLGALCALAGDISSFFIRPTGRQPQRGLGEVITRHVQAGNGVYNQEPLIQHFGLDTVPSVREIIVTWPNNLLHNGTQFFLIMKQKVPPV